MSIIDLRITIQSIIHPSISLFRINVDLKRTVYCYAVAEGGEKEWDFGWERYQNSNVGSEKDNILMALGCSSKIWLLNRHL